MKTFRINWLNRCPATHIDFQAERPKCATCAHRQDGEPDDPYCNAMAALEEHAVRTGERRRALLVGASDTSSGFTPTGVAVDIGGSEWTDWWQLVGLGVARAGTVEDERQVFHVVDPEAWHE
jgi:hypothetical protein